ncbi:MAG: multifunctional CCA tRNA nucleotidyl transferase/2'3'-cyclic phosphodiesterase/2'nucleotidase/phosphatase [Candidatus Thiodiazotropha sp. DIVDIV]
MKIYLVGGAVRDQLLGLPYTERDWVVVGATPEEMLAKGFSRADRDFPVFLHPESGEEYALARVEVKTAPGYKGFELSYGPEITLEQDLLRRDLTINALAMDDSGNVIDICGGKDDLDEGILRHISPAFSEDPLRLLRIARFAAKLGKWGFRVAHATHGLMKKMSIESELQTLSAERIWREMSRAMEESQPWRFFEVLHRCGALQGLLPEVALEMDRDTGGHGSEEVSHLVATLKSVVSISDESSVRSAVALFHSAQKQSDPDAWIRLRRIDKQTGQTLGDLLRLSSQLDLMDGADTLFDLVLMLKPQQQPERFRRFLICIQALWPSIADHLTTRLDHAMQVVMTPLPEEISQSDLKGRALGDAIRTWRLASLKQKLNGMDN